MGEFSDDIIAQAWIRSGGQCECQRGHGHGSLRCSNMIVLGNRGRTGQGAWEAHHPTSVDAGGDDSLSNCELLCWDCHRQTF